MDFKKLAVESSSSIISFGTEGGGYWEAWDRFLLVDDKKAFHLGNICGTCEFFFERLDGAKKGVQAQEAIDALNNGSFTIDSKLLDELKRILPKGKYILLKRNIKPMLVQPHGKGDYFTSESVDNWGIDGFYNLPHHTKTEYYRLGQKYKGSDTIHFDFLIPMFPSNWLDSDRVRYYQEQKSDGKPTVLSLSVLDVKEPVDENTKTHFCMANYIIDGHHKAYQAAQSGKEISMISFIALEHGVSSEEDVINFIS